MNRNGKVKCRASGRDSLPRGQATSPRAWMMIPIAVLSLLVYSPLLWGNSVTMHVTKKYLNVPIGSDAEMHVFQLASGGAVRREFPVQLATQSVDYWIFLDATEFKGQDITISGPTSQSSLNRIYQADSIWENSSLYHESARPIFHFTVKRGWSNDINGPVYYEGKYHLFWQAFPFGVVWDTGFMYWGHATSTDLVHWQELPAALMLDRLGSPWSGTSVVDHESRAGFGKDALVLVYTAFDRHTKKQVQCLAYSTDSGKTFTRYSRNPVLDTNDEVGSVDTRDPKVFWYAPTNHFVMALFEKDGVSFLSSKDLKGWTRRSHIEGFHECPDMFELAVDGDSGQKKWVLHGGSSNYMIGSFDGERFTPETPLLSYAEGKTSKGEDVLYAAEHFEEAPDGRRIQMAWGRISFRDTPFTQMILFPTEFHIVKTDAGLRLRAVPIREISTLHASQRSWHNISIAEANHALDSAARGPVQVEVSTTIEQGEQLSILYQGVVLAVLSGKDIGPGNVDLNILVDKGVAEVFVNGGARYIVTDLHEVPAGGALEFTAGGSQTATINRMNVYSMRSIWQTSAAEAKSRIEHKQ